MLRVFDGNRYPNAVNGSLWSLPVEFLMYIVVALVGVLHGNRWVMAGLAVASALTCLLWAQVSQSAVVVYGFDLRQAFICGTYFWVGATIQKFGLVRHLVVRAFLEFNTAWQLIWAAHFMGTRYTTSVQATFPRYPLLGGGSSIWLRRVTK